MRQVIYGSRLLSNNRWLYHSWLANKTLALLTNLLYGSRLTDIETCYKLVRTDLLRSLDLQNNRFDIETEITAKLLRRSVVIYEVPISYNARRKGKKVKPIDFLWAVWDLIRWRWRR